jgi:hypothetical protein
MTEAELQGCQPRTKGPGGKLAPLATLQHSQVNQNFDMGTVFKSAKSAPGDRGGACDT